MKKVFKNTEEVSHIWASRTHDEGRAASVYFQKDVIFSYGSHFPVASFYDNGKNTIVLFTSESYSVTTAKHKSIISYACNHFKKIVCPQVQNRFGENNQHEKNLSYFVEEIYKLRKEALKSRKNGQYFIQETNEKAENLKDYLTFFNLKGNKETKAVLSLHKKGLFSDKEKEKILNQIKIESAQKRIENKALKLRKEKEAAERLEKIKDKLKQWKEGQEVSFYYFDNVPIDIRIKNNEIETTKGAKVPLNEGLSLYKSIREGQNVEGRKIGNYTVNRLENNVLVIGCHKIPMMAIEDTLGNLI